MSVGALSGIGGIMKTAAKTISIWITILLLSILTGYAKDKGREKESRESRRTGAHVDVVAFAESHRELIRHHYVPSRGSLPPGLAKRRGDLPPGLQKQLVRHGHLPPGLEKKLYPFPVELERRLPPLRPGRVRGMIGGNAIILDSKTKVILDVFAIF
jgi:hypothetical protein